MPHSWAQSYNQREGSLFAAGRQTGNGEADPGRMGSGGGNGEWAVESQG